MFEPGLIDNNKITSDKRGKISMLQIKKKFNLNQINFSLSNKYVVRGMHFQKEIKQNKILILNHGKILDVLVNLKNNKITYYNIDINNQFLMIPDYCAHGFQVLSSNVSLTYLFDNNYSQRCQIGFDAFDKDLSIKWKKTIKKIRSNKDKLLNSYENFKKSL